MGLDPIKTFLVTTCIYSLHAAWASYQEALHSEVRLGHWQSIEVDKASSRGAEVGRLCESRAP